MKPPVFVGPTLSSHPVLRDESFDWHPPARVGDFYRAARAMPKMIGLIDGQFETTPTVWHKEILWALSKGIRVYGAASVGALRAVELAPFGMIGVGSIFRDFRDGRLQNDDEVALVHASGDLEFRPLTEPLVDIRASLCAAVDVAIISQRTALRLTEIAANMFFKDRKWPKVFTIASEVPIPNAQLMRLKRWLSSNHISQKEIDALAMIKRMRRDLVRQNPPSKNQFSFQHTGHWQRVVDIHGEPGRLSRASMT